MLDLVKTSPVDRAEAGYEFTVLFPDGTETEAKIKVRGLLSPAVKAFGRKMYQELTMRDNAAKRKGKDAEMSLEDAEDYAARSAANRIISWSGIGADGKEIPFSKEAAETLMREQTWIRDQVVEESETALNFRFE